MGVNDVFQGKTVQIKSLTQRFNQSYVAKARDIDPNYCMLTADGRQLRQSCTRDFKKFSFAESNHV